MRRKRSAARRPPDTPGAGSPGRRPGAPSGRGRRGCAPCGAGSVARDAGRAGARTAARQLLALRQVLAGRFRGHHAFLIGQLLAHLDYLDEAIGILSGQVETAIAPFADALTRLDSIPGINQRTAEVIIAEIGVDMSAFPSAGHLASWAALCPGNHESAGKHQSGKTRKGNRWLRTALIEAAAGASRVKTSALQARFRRALRHRGPKKAVAPVAHALLRAAYHVLADHSVYRELGAD